MSSLIGALRVTLGLDSAAFEKGATRAEMRSRALGNSAEDLGTRVGKMGKALAVAGGAFLGLEVVGAIGRMVKSGLDHASALGEQAKQLGVSTKALQEYRYAATQVGLSQDEMDKALAKLTRTMGEAANGSKKSSEAFAKLGIDIGAFVASGRDAGDLIPLIAEGMTKIGTEAEKAVITTALFGKSGQQLGPLLAEGAAGVNNLRDAAKKLGIVLSEEQIQKADESADKLAELQTVLQAQIAGAVSDNAESILELVKALTSLIVKAGEAAKAWREFTKSQWGAYLTQPNAPLPDAVNIRRLMTVRSTPSAATQRGAAARPSRPAQGFGATLRGMFTVRRGSNLAGEGLAPASALLGHALGGVGPEGLAAISGQYQALGQQLRTLKQESINAEAPLSKPYRAASETLAEMGERVADVSDNVKGLAEDGRKTAEVLKRSFADAAQGISSALSSLSSAIQGGGFLDILSALIGLGVELGSSGVFGSGAANSLNGISASGKNGSGSFKGGIGALSGKTGNLPGYATGTMSAARGWALVGERGPELVNFKGGERVYPNGTGPGGGGNTYYFSGVMSTDDFLAQIEQGHQRAARAGARGGVQLAQRRAQRRVG